MKKLIIATSLLWSANLLADPTNAVLTQDTMQNNTATVAPTSVMQNTQVNDAITHDSYGGGVSCARATMNAGIVQNFNGEFDEPQVFVGFSMPIGGDYNCEDAARKQISLTHVRTMSLKEKIRRDNESHVSELRLADIKYADLLAKICMNHHGKVLAKRDTTMNQECKAFAPTKVKHGHEKADTFDESEYARIADHSHVDHGHKDNQHNLDHE